MELLTSDSGFLLWKLGGEVLERNRKEVFGIVHTNWKNSL
jgi:hypothetical protein